MSKNAKNARRHAEARQMSAQRKKGNKGPARTKKTNTKVLTWFARKDGKLGAAQVAKAEALAARKAESNTDE